MGDHSLGVMWVFQAAASNSSDPIDSFLSPEDQGAKICMPKLSRIGDGVGTEPGPGERPGWQQVLASKGLKCRLQVRKGRRRKVKVQDWEPGRK